MNMTLELDLTGDMSRGVYATLGFDIEFRWGAIAVMDFLDWFAGDLPLDKLLRFFVHRKRENSMLYCVRHEEREAFKVQFWVIPFDTGSWILIGATCFIFTSILRCRWIHVVAAFLRQGVSVANREKLLILLVFVVIVLTICYESIISSVIMVPSPAIVADTLIDLFQSGYQLLIGFEKSVDGTPVAYGDSVYIRKHNLSWNQKLFDTDLIVNRE